MIGKKISIIGCPGSGKSTLAKKLAKEYNLPLVHLDSIYWRKNWTNISNEEFDKILEEKMAKDRWLIDGNFDRTIIKRIEKSDTIIYLDYHRMTCVIRVIKRLIKNRGRVRSDMGESCYEKFDLEFIKFIWGFNKSNRDKYYKLLEAEKNKNIYILKNKKDINYLNKIFSGK